MGISIDSSRKKSKHLHYHLDQHLSLTLGIEFTPVIKHGHQHLNRVDQLLTIVDRLSWELHPLGMRLSIYR
jgi:hypothetical protein